MQFGDLFILAVICKAVYLIAQFITISEREERRKTVPARRVPRTRR